MYRHFNLPVINSKYNRYRLHACKYNSFYFNFKIYYILSVHVQYHARKRRIMRSR